MELATAHKHSCAIVLQFIAFLREWLRNLKKDDFIISVDGINCEYCDFKRFQLSKNVKGCLEKKIFENSKNIVMYATPDNENHCPVTAVKLYLKKLHHENDELFPKPLKNASITCTGPWYCKKGVLGKNTLCDKMKEISRKAHLSEIYTNHYH